MSQQLANNQPYQLTLPLMKKSPTLRVATSASADKARSAWEAWRAGGPAAGIVAETKSWQTWFTARERTRG